MIRVIWEVILFLLPFALYYLYTRVAERDEEGNLGHAHPWTWLFIAGLVLAIGGLVWVALTENSTGTYVPAHSENGRVVPGHFDEPASAPATAPAPAPAP